MDTWQMFVASLNPVAVEFERHGAAPFDELPGSDADRWMRDMHAIKAARFHGLRRYEVRGGEMAEYRARHWAKVRKRERELDAFVAGQEKQFLEMEALQGQKAG